jgi:hypothetical protein
MRKYCNPEGRSHGEKIDHSREEHGEEEDSRRTPLSNGNLEHLIAANTLTDSNDFRKPTPCDHTFQLDELSCLSHVKGSRHELHLFSLIVNDPLVNIHI